MYEAGKARWREDIMKRLTIAALAAAQIATAAQPAMAAELVGENGTVAARQGAFAGARLRIPLDGAGARKAQAGLTLAPQISGRQADGSLRTRFGEGLELRLAGESKPQLALGGRSFAQLTAGRTGPDDRKMGISTIGWVAIGVGVTAIVLVGLGVACQETNCTNSE
jgi:hypothetical protein